MVARKSGAVDEVDGASPGKIFIGGLSKDTTLDIFTKYFEQYGEVVDSVIMKDRHTGKPRGFGFITYADPSAVDTVIKAEHIINGKQVEIKRTIPKGAAQTNDFKTKKIFVGGIPTSMTVDEFKDFFMKFGNVVDGEIILDHATKRSRGFGFIVFDSDKVVDDILANGNMIDMNDTRVEIKKAEPKKSLNPTSGAALGSNPRARAYAADNVRGYPDIFSGYGGGYSASYRGYAGLSSRFGDYGGYGSGNAGFGGYRGEPFFGYSSRYGSYGGSLGGGYGTGVGGYGRGGPVSGYGAYGGAGAMYGNRAGYSGSSRYHPYTR